MISSESIQMKFRIFWPIIGLMLLSACSNDIEVNVTFSQSHNLSKNDPVWFDGEKIGSVAKINTDNGTRAELELDPELSKLLYTGAVARITETPQKGIEILNSKNGNPISSGAELKGLNTPLEVSAWAAGGALGSLNELFVSAAVALNNSFNSQDFQDLSKQLQQTIQQLSDDSSGALNNILNNFEEVMQQVESQSGDVKTYAENLSKVLAEKMTQLQGQGEENLSKMLEDLQKELDSALNDTAPTTPNESQNSVSEEDTSVKL